MPNRCIGFSKRGPEESGVEYMKMVFGKTGGLYLLILVCLIMAISSSIAQDEKPVDPINFNVTVTPDTATIGDEITVLIEADYPKDMELSEPAVKSTDNTFVVAPNPEIKSKTKGDRKYDEYKFKISAFAKGEVELPLFEFFYYDSKGNQNSRMAPITTVYIKSVLPANTKPDSLQLKDIIGPKSLPILWWPYIVGGAILILLGAALYYFYKRKTRDFVIPEAPPEPPFDVAIRRLNALKVEYLPQKGKYKQYYVTLSEIIRYYIEGRFEVKAVESTTYELKRIFKHPDLTRDQIKEILDFLGRADLVKFAKQVPALEMPNKDYEQVLNFVISTKPVERPVEEVKVAS